jgi:hypothetical protein
VRTIPPLDETEWYRSCDVYLNALTIPKALPASSTIRSGGYRFHANNLTLGNSLEVGVRERAVLDPFQHPKKTSMVRPTSIQTGDFVGHLWAETNRPLSS